MRTSLVILFSLFALCSCSLFQKDDIYEVLSPTSRPEGPTTDHPLPPDDFTQRWYTTPGGCTYSRAQAPGYAPSWHLVLNGAQYRMQSSSLDCPAHLGLGRLL